MTNEELELTEKNARFNLSFYLEHYFECWTDGDVWGQRNAFFLVQGVAYMC